MSSEDESNVPIKEENLDEMLQWDSSHKSAFAPYKNVTTVLTNLQRGNIETRLPEQDVSGEISFHSKAGMGSLSAKDLTKDIDVNDTTESKLTPLMWACAYGQLPTAKLLIQHGALVHFAAENGSTSLLMAAAFGHHEVVRMLLSYGANPNHQDMKGNTALMYACHADHPHCVSELIENGSDVTILNDEDNNAYGVAVKRGSKQAQHVLEKFILRQLENS